MSIKVIIFAVLHAKRVVEGAVHAHLHALKGITKGSNPGDLSPGLQSSWQDVLMHVGCLENDHRISIP